MLFSFAPDAESQQSAPASLEERATPQLELRKTMRTREYQEKTVEGEERVIAPGDSLWRMLIVEKGLAEKRFGRYLVVIAALNPDIENLNVLRVGEVLFIPLKPDEILSLRSLAGPRPSAHSRGAGMQGDIQIYRVKRGDSLHTILLEQLDLAGKEDLRKTFKQVRQLNPGKRNWDLLYVGEMIRLPSPAPLAAVPRQETKEPNESVPEVAQLADASRLPARDNLFLLEQVLEALGNEILRDGEEVLPVADGAVRMDRASYPVVVNPKLEQKVILDLEDRIPASLRSRLARQRVAVPVVALTENASLKEIVSQLLSHLGFQALPQDRPVALRDGGAGLEIKGDWVVLAPEESNKAQEMLIISLTDPGEETPQYLRGYLSSKGMRLKEIVVPKQWAVQIKSNPDEAVSSGLLRQLVDKGYDGYIEQAVVKGKTWYRVRVGPLPKREEAEKLKEILKSKEGFVDAFTVGFTPDSTTGSDPAHEKSVPQNWPQEKVQLIDSLLAAYDIPFTSARELSVAVREGIRFQARCDRWFVYNGRKFALFFHPVGEEIKKALHDSEGTSAVEFNLGTLSSREVLRRLFSALGEETSYRDHRFPALDGGKKDRVLLSFPGFLASGKALFLTDREIPAALQRFFFEKGLQVIYFR